MFQKLKVKLKNILKKIIYKIIFRIDIILGFLCLDGKNYRLITKKFLTYQLIDTKTFFLNEINEDGSFNRLDTIVRYLAIEEYYGKNNIGFNLYEKMQKKRNPHLNIDYLRIFKNTIKSFEENGYDLEYPLEVDNCLKLEDGSHRFSLILYHNIPRLSFKIVKNRKTNVYYGINWFKNNNFTEDEINIVLNKFKEIRQNYLSEFVGIIWGPGIKYKDEIYNDILKLPSVKEITTLKEIIFENETEFENYVRGIYYIDDIENWKINKKISYMKNYDLKVCVFLLILDNPKYRAKAINGKPISVTVENIKKEIRGKYKDKIKNYFYDILIHIGDNEEQSIYMEKISEKDLNIEEFITSIADCNYVILKNEAPYSMKNFPKEYPFHKDLDILCSEQDFDKIIKKSLEFSEKYKSKYTVRILKSTDNFKLRFELNSYLCYQIDLSYKYDNEDTERILNNKEKMKNYFIPSLNDEIIIRKKEYEKNSNKKHHLEFIQKYEKEIKNEKSGNNSIKSRF